MKLVGLAFFLSIIYFVSCSGPKSVAGVDAFTYSINKKVECSNGAVVSAHPIASQVGLEILKAGGNAVDAAIATQLALAVVYPGAGNIGGGGFLVARLADGTNLTIDYREKAPGKASKNMYLDSAGNPLTDKSQNGHLSAGVPGTVAGLFESHKHGRLPFKTLIEPAIRLAESGFAITQDEAGSLNHYKNEFLELNTVLPVFVKATPWKKGDTLRQPDLAKTLRRIRDKGKNGFYGGETARLIEAEMKRGNGLITSADLKDYKAVRRDAIVFNYKNYTIITMPLPSSGGIILPQMLKMIEDKPIRDYGFLSSKAVQLMTEVERRAYADRAKWLGDPDFQKVPVKALLSDEYLRGRMSDYQSEKAGRSSDVQAGNFSESEETTHLSVYDKEGNAVAVTTTLNGGYGSRTVVAGAGFLLNNEMDDFSIKPGTPNMYGAIGAEANAIQPGKRMLSSMTPTIVLQNGRPYLVVGTPGGTTIPTSVFQTLVDILDFNMGAEEAVNAPKFHHQWLPDEVFIEKDFPEKTKAQLEAMGYKLTSRGYIGRTEVIQILPDGKIIAVGDKRGDDAAAGY